MINQAYPSIDGIAASWADIQVTTIVSGGALVETTDIAAIKTADKMEVGRQEGTSGGRTMKRTQGKATYEASMTLYKSGYRNFIKALKDSAPSRGNQKVIGVVAFDILIQHTPINEEEIYVRKLKGCRYAGGSHDMKEGTDADQVEVTLDVLEIVDIIDGEEVILL